MKKLFLFLLVSFFLYSFSSFSQENQSSADISPSLTAAPVNPNATEAIWDVLFNHNLQTLSNGSLGKAGVCFIPTVNQIWVSYWNTAVSNYILSFTPAGTLIDSFLVSGVVGIRAFTFDGQFVYAGLNTTTIQKINPVTRAAVGTITAPQTVRYLTYDPTANSGAGGLWLGNFTTNLQLISMTGTVLQTWPYAQLGNTSIYGAAFDNVSIGGPFLWLWGQGAGTGTPQMISQLNPATGLPTGVQHDALLDVGLGNSGAIAGGLFLSKDIISGKIALMGVLQGVPDRLFAYEIGTTDAGVLAPFNLTSPAAGATITSIPASTTPITITWDTSRASATYKWIFGAPTVPPRTLTYPTTSNSLTLTLGQLDNILASLGLAQGDSITGQWDVWAFRNNAPAYDSLKATNGPRALKLKRQKPPLTPFSLVSPPNNTTIVTSVFNGSPVTATWTKSGAGATYKWKFGTGLVSDRTEAVILTMPSNNSGFDTILTVINSSLDAVLAGLGLAPGDSMVGQWTVYAYSGTDSLKATQTWNLTLKRQSKGDVLIAYDSTSTACRASKDSVALYLSNNGKTFDLFNRGTQTSTSAISFRGYKTIVWLGEATSVMSAVQKDSMKAYLNNPPSGQKSKLIIFAEDIGYQFGRTGSTYIDLDFMNNYLGANFVLDRPSSGAAQGFYGSYINSGSTDSTVGSWPDVLSRFDLPSTHDLYKFRGDGSTNGVGKVGATFNVCTFGVDIESMRWAVDGPGVPPYKTRLDGAFIYVNTNGTMIPVELTSFTSKVIGNNVVLSWSTATEVNNSGFQVERKLANGNFTSVGFVKGYGTTTEEQNYVFSDNNVVVGKYTYRLKQVDFGGTFDYSSEIEVEVVVPEKFDLSQNYPNPFNPSTSIKFNLATDSKVTLKLFDVIGQVVATLINTDLAAGYHSIVVDGSNLSSGVYFYRLDAAGVNGQKYSSVKKMILTK